MGGHAAKIAVCFHQQCVRAAPGSLNTSSNTGWAAAQTVMRVHSKAHVHFVLDHDKARVIAAGDLALRQIKASDNIGLFDVEARFRLHRPVDTILTCANTDVGTGKASAADVIIIVAEYHDIFAVILDNTCIEHQFAGIRHIAVFQHRILLVSGDAGMRGQLKFAHGLSLQ